jgi:hypothetical protein
VKLEDIVFVGGEVGGGSNDVVVLGAAPVVVGDDGVDCVEGDDGDESDEFDDN